MKKFTLLFLACILTALSNIGFAQVLSYYQTGEEFSGPFPSWVNVKTAFGAVGDGVHNDAPNINAALQALRNSSSDSFNVLYFPAGNYLINDSIYNPNGDYADMAIIGEDPATTKITWGGPSMSSSGNSGQAMFSLQGWYLRISRLTFEGNNNAYRGIFKTGTFSTHCEFSDIVFKDFNAGIGLDFSAPVDGQAEDAIIRCSFINCESGIASCDWNSLDQWVWWCLFEDCNIGVNQCIGYCQIYDNVFLRSKDVDISSSPYKNAIVNNVSINSKCFYNGYENYQRGNKIYSNVDSFYTDAGSSTVMLDNIIRATKDSLAPVRVNSYNMFIGNTETKINSEWTDWPVQPPYDNWDHGFGSNFNIGKQIEKAIDGNAATSFATQIQPFGVKWNCPHNTTRTAVKYTVSAPVSSGGDSPLNFQLLGSNNWGYTWDTLDQEVGQNFTGGGNPNNYTIKTPGAYSMYELYALSNEWPWVFTTGGGRAIVNTGSESGTYCEEMTLSMFPRYVYQAIKVHADSVYNVSGWMKSNAISTNAYILVLWYNTSSPIPPGAIPTGYIRSDTIGVITGTNGWTNYAKTVTAPGNALSAYMFLEDEYLPTSSGTAWFDNFSFVETTNLANNLCLNPSFENGGVNTYQQWFEVSELTILDGSNSDITKDPAGFVSAADEAWGQFYPLDNAVVDTSAIAFPDSISLPATPQNLNRKIFEVLKNTGNDAAEIQSKIDSAALPSSGDKPVVHIPFGNFKINTTLTVPAGCNMQIIGDGLGTGTNATTSLTWNGNNIGPLMLCMGPSRVTIKDLLLNANYSSYVGPEALVIQDADQVGGRIYGQEFNAGGPQWTQPCGVGMWANQIENSDITMICFFPGFGDSAMVLATGGPVLSSGGNTNGQISLLAGATGDSQNLFGVSEGGRIDAEGMWNEGDWTRTSGLLNLSNTFGKVSVACMSWNLLTSTYPMTNTDNFSGTLTLLLNHFNNQPWAYMPLTGSGTNFNVLAAYNDWGQSDTKGKTTDSTWMDSTSPNANADFIGNTGNGGFLCDVVTSKVHGVLPDSNSILEELSQLRAVRTNPPMDLAPSLTDVKLFRVAAWGTAGHPAAEFNRVGYTAGVKNVTQTVSNFVTLYPTVVSQTYTVSFTISEGGPATFTVFDVFGRMVSEKEITEAQGSHSELFYAGGLRAGTYYMQFHSGSIVETKKFVVLQ
jgi:hypothetical protein